MNQTTTLECLDCGHVHEIEIVTGETEFDDYAEAPDCCETCGAALADDVESEAAARRTERQQMGITG
jgi:transcription elongation factor Elf1